MSDSFADLWSSSAPPPKVKTLGSISRSPAPSPTIAPTNHAYRRADAFSLLSSAGSSISSSRSITPASEQKPNAPSPKPQVSTSTVSGDAFSSLISGELLSNSTSQMTMAQRAALVEKERWEASSIAQAAPKSTSAWDDLDSLGGSSSLTPSRPSITTTSVSDDDWGLGDFGIAKPSPLNPKPQQRTVVTEDDLGLSEFATAPAQSHQARPVDNGRDIEGHSATRSKNLWDMDTNTDPPRKGISPAQRSDTPSKDFDFGNREDGLFGNNDEDDILGDLAKPPNHSRRPSPTTQVRDTPNLHRTQPPRTQSRTASPPPHILGRIVEMGFSIQQARVALAATETGIDVEAALENLLSNGAAEDSSHSSPPPSLPRRPTGDASAPAPRRRDARASPYSDTNVELNIQEQADRIMAQASQIGLSIFNKATSAWKDGREKVQKVYAERVAEVGDSGRGASRTPVNGRPKWMQGEGGIEADGVQSTSNGHGFTDDGDGPVPQPTRPQRQAVQQSEPTRQQSPAVANLFSAEEVPAPAKPYVSRFRHAASAPSNAQTRRPRTPPPARPLRDLVTASSSSITTSRNHKDRGAEKFKLGQYGDAETSYTQAIECLPGGHLLLIPLYNNRALVRLKTGDYAAAIGDSAAVIDLVDEGTWQDEQKRIKSTEEGAGVDLGDSLVKAWKRRAEAFEGREKWDDARKDWERVAGAGWAASGLRNEGVRGAGRCRKMVNADKKAQDPSAPKPQPARRPPVRRGPTPPSQAAMNFKKANDAATAEDDAKHQLKDTVDARLVAWKGGKETNIRALIASLDCVLWPELGLQKTSIAELVTPAQVKTRYTKAIAKLHPDKLNANNSTLEQRMIANGVFGTLNEAWNAFKQ